MLSITGIFDQELAGTPGEGMDPLGDLVISDRDSEIRIHNTYLDSWLAGLIDGLRQLATKNHVRIETEEPEPISLDLYPGGRLVISYKEKKVVALGTAELERSLRAAVSRFLNEIRDAPDASRNRLIDPIRMFSVTTTN
jgi:hypothetical protein